MIEITAAVESDLDGITRLEEQIFPDAWHRNSIEESYRQDYVTVIVARECGEVLGYLICYRILNEGEIARIAVDHKYRRLGIAGRMLEMLFREGKALGLTEYSLEVRESNLPAISLYERYLFAAEGRRKNFYTAPVEDGLVMWRRSLN